MAKIILYHGSEKIIETPEVNGGKENNDYDRAQSIPAAKRLQSYRKKLGLSQSELAKAADVNIRTLQQYESGAKDISKASVATVVSLGKVLKCPVEDFILL
ncbi:MAG: helix-turn-helix domain-containing protein [Pseudobutyrivibrio sp.]|nr:helix-turn-helix domain-containing protein [Pseudobutyrivibrio sp.]